MISMSPPVVPQPAQTKSFRGSTTTRSGGLLCRVVIRSRCRSGRSAAVQCVRYADSTAGSPASVNRNTRRSRVAAR